MAASTSTNPFATAHPNAGGAYALAENECQAGVLGSSVMKPGFLQVANVILTPAQVTTMYTTPVQLIAGVTGQSIMLHKVLIRVLSTGNTAYAGGGVAVIQDGNAAHGAGTALTTTNATAANINSATNADFVLAGAAYTFTNGDGAYISNQTGVFTGGTGTNVQVLVWYSQF